MAGGDPKEGGREGEHANTIQQTTAHTSLSPSLPLHPSYSASFNLPFFLSFPLTQLLFLSFPLTFPFFLSFPLTQPLFLSLLFRSLSSPPSPFRLYPLGREVDTNTASEPTYTFSSSSSSSSPPPLNLLSSSTTSTSSRKLRDEWKEKDIIFVSSQFPLYVRFLILLLVLFFLSLLYKHPLVNKCKEEKNYHGKLKKKKKKKKKAEEGGVPCKASTFINKRLSSSSRFL